MSLVTRIKNLSNNKKITIAELERKLDFPYGSIRKWDEHQPGIKKIEKVADYFDVSTDYLLGRIDDPVPFKKTDKDNSNLRAIQRGAQKLSPEDQEILLKYMQFTFKNISNGKFKHDASKDNF